MNRRTQNRVVGAEHTAIARMRLLNRSAAFTVVAELAGVTRHGVRFQGLAHEAGNTRVAILLPVHPFVDGFPHGVHDRAHSN